MPSGGPDTAVARIGQYGSDQIGNGGFIFRNQDLVHALISLYNIHRGSFHHFCIMAGETARQPSGDKNGARQAASAVFPGEIPSVVDPHNGQMAV